VEIDVEISPQWEKPQEGYNDEGDCGDQDQEVIRFGMQGIDRLISALGEQLMLPTLSALVQ
jgi:hypothetical protein